MLVLRRLITMLLLLFCLVPLGMPLGMVLCFGADGHIGFEPMHDRSHGTTSAAAAGTVPPTQDEHPSPASNTQAPAPM